MTSRLLPALPLATALLLASPLSAQEAPPESAPEEGESACADEEEHSFVALSLSVLPRVDGWDPSYGHRSGWGLAGGIEFSPWRSETMIHLEVTYLTNREQRLISADFGLKVPFHRGVEWDVHGVIGPALAFEHFQHTAEDGTRKESEFVVGMIAGLGTTYWFHRHVGATVDVSYRILGGEGIAHRLFTGLGIASRW